MSVSRWALLSFLLEHRDILSKLLELVPQFLDAQGVIAKAEALCEVIKTLAPIVDDLIASADGVSADGDVEGVGAANGISPALLTTLLPLLLELVQMLRNR